MVLRLLSAFPRLFGAGADPARSGAKIAVARIAEAARTPAFYIEGGVPDEVEGRFDVLTLHLYAVLVGLRGRPIEGVFGQLLFDEFFQNIDDNLREMGVGDTVVGKRIRKLAEAFYGRVTAFDEARAPGGGSTLAQAIGRNIHGRSGDPRAGLLALWVEDSIEAIEAMSDDTLLSGQVSFPPFPSSGDRHE